MYKVCRHIICLAVLLSAERASALALPDVFLLLEHHGVPFDSNRVERAALEGALRAVDPLATLIDTDAPAATQAAGTLSLGEKWGEGICYLKLDGLNPGGETNVLGLLREWESAGGSGLIVDLRGAGGGCLVCVDAVAGALDGNKAETYTVRNGRGEILETRMIHGSGGFWSARPLMLLVDGKTTGASELFASILKSRGGVMLIGATTGGDGALRETVTIEEGLSVRMATRWIALSDSEGVLVRGAMAPDIEVSADASSGIHLPDEDAVGSRVSQKKRVDMTLLARVMDDAALARATDILLGLKALESNGEDGTDALAGDAAESR